MTDTKTPLQAISSWVLWPKEVALVSIGEKIKALRKEKGWSQDEFADHAQIDGRQVSRYENDRVTPSIEVAVKMAQAFNISLDFLLTDSIPKRPLVAPNTKFAQRVLAIEHLSDEDERSLLHLVDAIEAKNKLKIIAANVE
jgi:transcriptional regulator with XRE-family HTH domain